MAHADEAVRLGDDLLLAGVRRCRHPYRPLADRGDQPFDLVAVGGERGNVELEIAGDDNLRGAERAKAGGVLVRLREAEADPREQGAGYPGEPVPAAEGTLRQARVDDHERHAGFREADHDGWPQL